MKSAEQEGRLNGGAAASVAANAVAWAGGGLLLLLTFRSAGLSPLTAVGTSFFFAAVLLPVGFLATARLRSEDLSLGERALLAAVVGYVLSALLVFFAGIAGLDAIVLPSLLALGPVALLVGWRTRRASAHRLDRAAHWTLPLVLPVVVMAVVWGDAPWAMRGATASYARGPDHLLHTSFYWELLRGVPPREIPTAAGVPFPRYHILGYLPGLLAVRARLVDPETLSHAVAPLFRLALFLGAVHVVLRLRTGDARKAVAVLALCTIPALCAEGLLARHIVGARWPALVYVFWGESGGSALLVWAAVFLLLVYHDRDPRRAPWALLVASLLAGSSYGIKAHVFLIFGGAYFLALFLHALRERTFRSLGLVALGVSVVLALVLAWAPEGRFGYPHLSPGAFVRAHVLPSMEKVKEGLLADVLARLRGAGPEPVRDAFLTAVGVWRIALFSPVVPLFAARTLRRWRQAPLADLTTALVFPVALAMFGLLGVAGMDGDVSAPFFAQMGYGVSLVSAVVSAAWLHDALNRWVFRTASPSALMLMVLVVCLAVAPWLPPPPRRSGPRLGTDALRALAFLRRATPLDAVVMGHLGAPGPYPVVAGLSGRRSVLEYYGGVVDPAHDRPGDIELFYRTSHEETAFAILSRYGVDYVLERKEQPLAFRKDRLEPAFESDAVRVYATGRTPIRNGVGPWDPLLPGLRGLAWPR